MNAIQGGSVDGVSMLELRALANGVANENESASDGRDRSGTGR